MHLRRLGAVLGIAALVLVGTGCSQANTSPSQAGLHYKGGPFSSQVFANCVAPGTLDWDGPADVHYYYPTGQRVLKFSKDADADFPPLQVTASGQVLEVSGSTALTLNVSCEPYTDKDGVYWPGGKLQKFHQTIGLQDGAFSLESGVEPGVGWKTFLGTRVKDTIDRSADNEALKFGWFELINNEKSKAAWELAVVEQVPDFVEAQLGEDFIRVDNIILQKPVAPAGLQAELLNREAATLRAASAETDKQAALSFPGGIEGYLDYQRRLAENKLQGVVAAAIEAGKIKAIPVPIGSSVIVAPQSGG